MYGERVLVETLGERNTWTALAVDGRPAQWRSLVRVLPPRMLGVLADAHDRREPVDTWLSSWLPGDRRTMAVSATPMVGPGRRVHSVQMRSTPDGSALPDLYTVAAFGYSVPERSIRLGDNTFDWDLPAGRASWTVPEAFRFVERFDRSMELILHTLDPPDRLRWTADITVTMAGAPRRIRLALRSDPDNRLLWRGLLHDVTDSLAPEPISLEGATLSALGRQQEGHHLALTAVRDVRLIRWITEPVPEVRWHGTADSRDTPHPDDMARICTAIGDMVRGACTHTYLEGIRLRRIGTGWVVVDARCTVLPAPNAPALMLVELTVTGTSDAPDPAEP